MKEKELIQAKSADSEFRKRSQELEMAEKRAKKERSQLVEKNRSADEHFLLTEITNARHKRSDFENEIESLLSQARFTKFGHVLFLRLYVFETYVSHQFVETKEKRNFILIYILIRNIFSLYQL